MEGGIKMEQDLLHEKIHDKQCVGGCHLYLSSLIQIIAIVLLFVGVCSFTL